MDPQFQPIASQPVAPAPQPAPAKSSNKLLIPLIFASILALAGIGFGVYKQFLEKPVDNCIKTAEVADETVEQEEWVENISASKKAEVVELLNKYYIHTEEDDLPMYTAGTVAGMISNFSDESIKYEYFTYAVVYNDDALEKSYSYDEIDELYHSYFGAENNYQKASQEYYCANLDYDSTNDSFRAYVNQDCGLGGTTPARIAYNIDSIKESGDDMIVLISTTIYSLVADEDIATTVKQSLAAYNLHFEKYGDTYALVDITK